MRRKEHGEQDPFSDAAFKSYQCFGTIKAEAKFDRSNLHSVIRI